MFQVFDVSMALFLLQAAQPGQCGAGPVSHIRKTNTHGSPGGAIDSGDPGSICARVICPGIPHSIAMFPVSLLSCQIKAKKQHTFSTFFLTQFTIFRFFCKTSNMHIAVPCVQMLLLDCY